MWAYYMILTKPEFAEMFNFLHKHIAEILNVGGQVHVYLH